MGMRRRGRRWRGVVDFLVTEWCDSFEDCIHWARMRYASSCHPLPPISWHSLPAPHPLDTPSLTPTPLGTPPLPPHPLGTFCLTLERVLEFLVTE